MPSAWIGPSSLTSSLANDSLVVVGIKPGTAGSHLVPSSVTWYIKLQRCFKSDSVMVNASKSKIQIMNSYSGSKTNIKTQHWINPSNIIWFRFSRNGSLDRKLSFIRYNAQMILNYKVIKFGCWLVMNGTRFEPVTYLTSWIRSVAP